MATVTGPKMEELLKALRSIGVILPADTKLEKPKPVGARSMAELLRSRSHCPNCGLYGGVAKNFGVRNMGNGTIRVQSWCRDCRIEPNNKRAKAFHKKGNR